jgi:hypothetical protein
VLALVLADPVAVIGGVLLIVFSGSQVLPVLAWPVLACSHCESLCESHDELLAAASAASFAALAAAAFAYFAAHRILAFSALTFDWWAIWSLVRW